ncbi:MAG: cupin domain-containing protein, partial [Holophagae bacterium]|nr:cupin domain-containing protein [Holophagae bacterium]
RRKELGLTLETLAGKTGLSKGLLSKIENFRTVPSVPVLAKVAQALDVDMGKLMEGIALQAEEEFQLIKVADRRRVERDNAQGFCYEMLGSLPTGTGVSDFYLLTVDPGARRDRVTTEGRQAVWVAEGRLVFQVDGQRVEMCTGDLLLFDGRIPHVPLNESTEPAVLFCAYLLEGETE